LLQGFPVSNAGDAQRVIAELRGDGLDKLALANVHRRTALFRSPIAIGIGVG
jgi:hypothetical protein